MSYEEFERLLKLKFSLGRVLHTETSGKSVIRRNMAVIDERLRACANYTKFLNRYGREVREVG